MNKGRFIKTVAATLCLTSMMSIVAFAKNYEKMGTYGEAYLNQNYSGGLRTATARTVPSDDPSKSKYQTLTLIKAYYEDGDVGERRDGPANRSTIAGYDYGYFESFTSFHRIMENAQFRAQAKLP